MKKVQSLLLVKHSMYPQSCKIEILLASFKIGKYDNLKELAEMLGVSRLILERCLRRLKKSFIDYAGLLKNLLMDIKIVA